MQAQKLRFTGDNHFQSVLRDRVDAHFESKGIKKTANWRMMLKAAFFLTTLLALCTVVLIAPLPGWMLAMLCLVAGVVAAGVGFNVGHDAIHGAFSDHASVNSFLSRTFDVIGASSTNWSVAHNFVHHTYTNVVGVDHDLEPGPFLRLYDKGPQNPPHFLHRFQFIYAFALYGFAYIVWVFRKDFNQAFRVDARTGERPPIQVFLSVCFWKVVHFAIFLGLPMAMGHAWWHVLVGYLLFLSSAGLTLAVVFQLAHCVEQVAFPPTPTDGRFDDSFHAHQMKTTANFATNSWFWNFFSGGLNHQVEHHLFSKICHIHYRDISKIVRETAAEFGLPYHEMPSFRAALISHIRTLRRFGMPALST
jgi:linoleoyl-CoA desaturase